MRKTRGKIGVKNDHHKILRLIFLLLRFVWPKLLLPPTNWVIKRRKSTILEEAVMSNLQV